MSKSISMFMLLLAIAPQARAAWTFLDLLTCTGADGTNIQTLGPALDGMSLPIRFQKDSDTDDVFATYTLKNGGVGNSGEANAIEIAANGLALEYVLKFDKPAIYPEIQTNQSVEGALYQKVTTFFLTTALVPVTDIKCEVRLKSH